MVYCYVLAPPMPILFSSGITLLLRYQVSLFSSEFCVIWFFIWLCYAMSLYTM